MHFSVDLLKQGKKLWCPELGYGRATYIFLVPRGQVITDPELPSVTYRALAFAAHRLSGGQVIPWSPTQAQVMSDSWEVVHEWRNECQCVTRCVGCTSQQEPVGE